MNLTVAIDDVNPKIGWRILGDKTEEYLFNLNKEFGVKFTLFIPSNHHGEAPISEHKEWITQLQNSGIFELAAHGHFHQTSNKNKWGECEFFELKDQQDIFNRLNLLITEWDKCNIKPKGWRNPGWLASPESIGQLQNIFEYSAVHYVHNRNNKWACKTIFGHDGINQTNISIHNDTNIMFQSHIAGDWNDNVWNKENYDQLRSNIKFLIKNYDIEFKTIAEL